MTTTKKAEDLVNAIEPPISLSQQQVQIARLYAKDKMLEGFTVQSFCTENRLSTKTLYSWFENPDFDHYLKQIQDAIIPQSEKEAFQELKKKVLQIAYKQSPTIKEIELFTDLFSYVIEADKHERMEAMGLLDERKPNTHKTIEEKKASLLARLTSK